MAIKDKDRKARANYLAKTKRMMVVLYPTDSDIISRLEEMKEAGEPATTYIKRLIREDMNKTAHEAEISLWFDDLGDDPINCPYCGLKLPQGVEICPACGKKNP